MRRFVKTETPLGNVWFSYTEKGLYSLEFPPGTRPEEAPSPEVGATEAGEGPGAAGAGDAADKSGDVAVAAATAVAAQEEPAWLPAFVAALKAFLAGKETDFTSFPVDYSGFSPFFTRVLKETHRVPYGCITSYGFLAEAAGRPGAYRAAGTCMGKNRLPLVIPCHRVIKRDGALGGFGSGIHWKKTLLKMEGVVLRRW